jgi:hypothetical protein
MPSHQDGQIPGILSYNGFVVVGKKSEGKRVEAWKKGWIS